MSLAPDLFTAVETTPVYTVQMHEGHPASAYAHALMLDGWPDRMTLRAPCGSLTFNNPRERRMYALGWRAAMAATQDD